MPASSLFASAPSAKALKLGLHWPQTVMPDRTSARRDVVYLDLALEATARSIIEADMAHVRAAAQSPEGLSQVALLVSMALQNACLSFGSNQELVLTLKSFRASLRPQDIPHVGLLQPSLHSAANTTACLHSLCSRQSVPSVQDRAFSVFKTDREGQAPWSANKVSQS